MFTFHPEGGRSSGFEAAWRSTTDPSRLWGAPFTQAVSDQILADTSRTGVVPRSQTVRCIQSRPARNLRYTPANGSASIQPDRPRQADRSLNAV